MRKLLIIVLFLIASCSTNVERNPSSDSKVIDIVFDLDWTLISKVSEDLKDKPSVIKIGDEFYRVHDWARELITSLVLDPKYRVSFFSGGPSSRNIKVLESIKLLDGSGRSFLDASHKALHREDLLFVDPPASLENPAPAESWKKDLRKVNPDLNRVVMFEDDYRHALNPRQRENILWMGMSYYHIDSKKDLETAAKELRGDSFVPPSVTEWQLQRNKLAMSYGVLEQAVEDLGGSNKNIGKLVQKRLKESGIEENKITNKGKLYFENGRSSLRKVNSRAQRIALEDNCHGLVSLFF